MMRLLANLVLVTSVMGESQVVSKEVPVGTTEYTYLGTQRKQLVHASPLQDLFEHIDHLRETHKSIDETKEQRKRARELRSKMSDFPPPNAENLERLTEEQLKELQANRQLNWFSSSSAGGANAFNVLADSSQYYDKWAQAYRLIGPYIDCDHAKSQNDRKRNNNNNNNYNSKSGACARWMIWAAYVNPYYQGNGYKEYYGDNPTSQLDCHNPDTQWELLGVYRQDFYQYIEQISKHLWAINDYNYVTALSGLSYMTYYDCRQVGQDKSGNSVYAGVAPQPYGKWQMALYTDTYCVTPDVSLGLTYDDFGTTTDVYLGDKDQTDDQKDWASDWWYAAQEYTLTNLNDVYEDFKYCTTCVDYPTYQDGYYIGNSGTDDDSLINQCWKFYSHDSYTCDAECIATAHAQGSILSLKYGDVYFGKSSSTFYSSKEEASNAASSSASNTPSVSPMTRLLANAFLTAAFLLFVATFLAFAVARRSRYRESRSSKSRRLLDEEEEDGRSRRSRRSTKSSRERDDEEGDGLFKSSRTHSKSRKSRSSSKSSKKGKRSKSYDPPIPKGQQDYF